MHLLRILRANTGDSEIGETRRDTIIVASTQIDPSLPHYDETTNYVHQY